MEATTGRTARLSVCPTATEGNRCLLLTRKAGEHIIVRLEEGEYLIVTTCFEERTSQFGCMLQWSTKSSWDYRKHTQITAQGFQIVLNRDQCINVSLYSESALEVRVAVSAPLDVNIDRWELLCRKDRPFAQALRQEWPHLFL
jgi:sRNA-binding carbon storage regulator CsrA